jgi:hypothetical protein
VVERTREEPRDVVTVVAGNVVAATVRVTVGGSLELMDEFPNGADVMTGDVLSPVVE